MNKPRRKENQVNNKSLSRFFRILAIGCFAAIVFFIVPSLFLVKNVITVPFVIFTLVIAGIGITAFATSRSYSSKKRGDKE